MKEIEAWAVVTERGNLVVDSVGMPRIIWTKASAERDCVREKGERVVRVTVRIEE